MVKLVTQEREALPELGEKLRPSVGIVCDGNKIENQEITLIDAPNHNCFDVDFKLTGRNLKRATMRLKRHLGRAVESGIIYKGASRSNADFFVCAAQEFKYGDAIIRLAEPLKKIDRLKDMFKRPGSGTYDAGTPRSAEGLVQIELPRPATQADLHEIEARLNEILTNLFEISGGLGAPDPEHERDYGLNRYAWWLNKDTDQLTVRETEAASRLERRQIIPGYSTLVSETKTSELEGKYGRFAPFHEIYDTKGVIDALKSGGLKSGMERHSRGAFVNGLSTPTDLYTGGADSVFTRTVAENARGGIGEVLFDGKGKGKGEREGYFIVMAPDLYNRTDFYSYSKDLYGSTAEIPFRRMRQSPDEVLDDQVHGEGFEERNEQMFRTGIPTESFRAIACFDHPDDKNVLVRALVERQLLDSESRKTLHEAGPAAVRDFLNDTCGIEDIDSLWQSGPNAVRGVLSHWGIDRLKLAGGLKTVDEFIATNPRMVMIDRLQRSGITAINGIPVEKFVVHAESYQDFIDVAYGDQSGSLSHYTPEEIYDIDPATAP